MHGWTVFRTYLRVGILNVLQYRTDFWFEILGILTGLVSALLGVNVVFSQTTNLGGWSKDDLYALIGIQMLVSGLISIVVAPSMRSFMEHVRLGTLDFTLVKPADSQLMASVSTVHVGSIAGIVVGSVVLAISLIRLGDTISPMYWLQFVIVLLAGLAVIYSFLLILSTLTFWFVKLDNILVIFEVMFDSAGHWPITIFPQWLRIGLTFLVPVAFAITVPAQSLTGRLSGMALLGTVALAVAFVTVSRFFWRHGLKHYTGASA
jgi:ABC-2 type transport system permease protein